MLGPLLGIFVFLEVKAANRTQWEFLSRLELVLSSYVAQLSLLHTAIAGRQVTKLPRTFSREEFIGKRPVTVHMGV